MDTKSDLHLFLFSTSNHLKDNMQTNNTSIQDKVGSGPALFHNTDHILGKNLYICRFTLCNYKECSTCEKYG